MGLEGKQTDRLNTRPPGGGREGKGGGVGKGRGEGEIGGEGDKHSSR